MKKTFTTLAVLSALSLSVVPTFAHGNQDFSYSGTKMSNNVNLNDIQGNWAEKYILDMVKKGVINGDGNGHFSPNSSVTRDQFAKMVTSYFNLTTTATTSDFEDISTSNWDFKYVEAAKNYFDAYRTIDGGLAFHPNAAAERQDVTVTLVKILQQQDPSLQVMDSISAEALLQQKFKDASQITPVLRPYVATAVKYNLIAGDGHGRFMPTASLTRAEAATLLDRLSSNTEIVLPGDGGTTTTGVSNATALTTTNNSVVTGIDNTNDTLSVANGTTVQALESDLSVGGGTGSVVVYTGNTKSALASGSAVLTNTMVVVATAQDGTTTATYSISVPTTVSNVTTLTTSNNVVVTGIDNTNDALSVANGTTVQALESDLSVGGGTGSVAVYTDNTKSALAGGSAVITNTMVVVATAQDGVTQATFTLSVPTAISNVTTLTTSNNSVVTGIDNTNDALTIANGTTVQDLENALSAGGGTGSVAVYTDNTKSALADGSAAITNTMIVVATAQDGTTTTTYTITI